MDKHLEIFITVVDVESFSKAAEIHYMTQPAVSQYIRELEKQMGTRLLERDNKKVSLNKAGEIVYHYGEEILGLHTQMRRLVRDLEYKANGPLVIGASYTFGEYVLPGIIAEMKQKYPQIKPSVTIANTKKIVSLVEKRQLDIGIVEGHYRKDITIHEDFASDEMVIVAAPNHPLVGCTNVTWQQLIRESWILREKGSGTREAAERLFAMWEIPPIESMTYSSTQPIKESVGSGFGISLLSKWAIQKELKHGELAIIDVVGLPLKRTFSYLRQSPFKTKAIDVFVELLRA